MITDKEIEELAREHAHLKPGFDRAEEEYYNSTAINAYESFQDGFKAAQSKLYSEEEVNRIIRRFENKLCQQFKYGDIDTRVKLVNDYITSIKK